MSVKVIAVINQKGGVGKSTIAVNTSYQLSAKKFRTLIIDLDPQAHSTCIFCQDVNKEKTIAKAFTDRNTNIEELIFPALLKTETQNSQINCLSIIPSSIHLALYIEQVTNRLYREKILDNHIATIKDQFDFIILDCPPTLGVLAINAIFSSNTIIIPSNYGRYALDGMADLLHSIKEIKNEQSYQYFILRNQYDRRTTQTNKFIHENLDYFQKNLLSTVIRKSETINQAQINSLPIQIFDPSGYGTKDFSQLTEEILLNVA